MKNNKEKKRPMSGSGSFVKLVIAMIIGAFIGGTGNMVISFFRKNMEQLSTRFEEAMPVAGVIAESMIVLVASAVVIGIYIYLGRLWKKEEASEDEAADRYGEKFEYWADIGLMISNVAVVIILIFGCIVFPNELNNLSIRRSNTELLWCLWLTAVLLLGVTVMSVMQILFIKLMQKRDPQKKGDPGDFNFNRKWLEGCDETEKLIIYQAGYKAFSAMQAMMLVAVVVCIFGKTQFGTGNFPLVMLGSVWIIGNLVFGFWGMKGLKRK